MSARSPACGCFVMVRLVLMSMSGMVSSSLGTAGQTAVAARAAEQAGAEAGPEILGVEGEATRFEHLADHVPDQLFHPVRPGIISEPLQEALRDALDGGVPEFRGDLQSENVLGLQQELPEPPAERGPSKVREASGFVRRLRQGHTSWLHDQVVLPCRSAQVKAPRRLPRDGVRGGRARRASARPHGLGRTPDAVRTQASKRSVSRKQTNQAPYNRR